MINLFSHTVTAASAFKKNSLFTATMSTWIEKNMMVQHCFGLKRNRKIKIFKQHKELDWSRESCNKIIKNYHQFM